MSLFRKVLNQWLKLGRVMGDFVARALLTVFYFSIFGVFALVAKVLLKNPKPDGDTYWLSRDIGGDSIEKAGRQF